MEKHGQSIIIVTVVLMALFVFVAISVDGARMYVIRRQMQTAADAGALAGAYEICRQGTKRSVKAEVVRFTKLNQAHDILMSMDKHDQTVSVTATFVGSTFFAGMFGLSELTVSAEAQAQATCDERSELGVPKVRLIK